MDSGDRNRIVELLRMQNESELMREDIELKILLTAPVGVGDHSCIVKDIERHIEKIDSLLGKREALLHLKGVVNKIDANTVNRDSVSEADVAAVQD